MSRLICFLMVATCVEGALAFSAAPMAQTALPVSFRTACQRGSAISFVQATSHAAKKDLFKQEGFRKGHRGVSLRQPLTLRAIEDPTDGGIVVGESCSLNCVVEITAEEQLYMYLQGASTPAELNELPEDSDDDNELTMFQLAIAAGMSPEEYGEVMKTHKQFAQEISSLYLQGNSKKRVTILEVYAPWCRKCLKMSKEVFAACREYTDKVVFLKMDAKQIPELSQKLGVRGMPTFIVYKDGERVDHFYAGTREDLMESIQNQI